MSLFSYDGGAGAPQSLDSCVLIGCVCADLAQVFGFLDGLKKDIGKVPFLVFHLAFNPNLSIFLPFKPRMLNISPLLLYSLARHVFPPCAVCSPGPFGQSDGTVAGQSTTHTLTHTHT